MMLKSVFDAVMDRRARRLDQARRRKAALGRGDVDFDERLRMDIEYIEQRSLWLDLRILILTIAAVLRRQGAY